MTPCTQLAEPVGARLETCSRARQPLGGTHAINAGPPLAGFAMGDPHKPGMLDLYLGDPQIPS